MNCSICWENKSNMVQTNCNHIFCKNCIDSWLEEKNNCPVCRHYYISYNKIKNKIKNKIITKKYIITKRVTRSQTEQERIQNIANQTHLYIENLEYLNSNYTDLRIQEIDKIFKLYYKNYYLIKKSAPSVNEALLKKIYKLEKNEKIIQGGYLDKIKLWKYKFLHF